MVLIRADANEIIGMGHVMRCLSIAHVFADRGEKVKFVTADHKCDGLINNNGFEVVCLNSRYNALDQESIVQVVIDNRPSLILVDSYYVTQEYFRLLSQYCCVAYVDDLNAEIWNVDILINYNIYGEHIDYSKYKMVKTLLLLGPKYAPLRREFVGIKSHRIKPVTDVLISAGGSDPEGITEKIMREICSKLKNIRFHFIIGALNPRLDIIKSRVLSNVVLHINEHNMSDLMQLCDVAISAAGSTLYELCACGTPTITYTLADNQLLAAKEFEKQEIMIYAGDCRHNLSFVQTLEYLLKNVIDDIDKRKKMASKMQLLVDGKGAERIVDCLINDKLRERQGFS